MLDSLPILSALVLIPLLGMIFTLMAKEDEDYHNSVSVTLFVVIFNMFVILKCFNMIDIDASGLQLIERFNWLDYPNIDIVFGVNVMSLLLMLAIHIALIIGLMGVWQNKNNQKPMMVWTSMFLGMLNGYFVSADIFSFYIFFEAMLLPVIMLIGMYGEVKKRSNIFRFFIYNLLGALMLFIAIIIIHNSTSDNVMLSQVGALINTEHKFELFVWTSVFLAFISRIPIWPFHYWISATSASIKNPLVFIIANIMPLTAIYGFIEFLPLEMPTCVSYYIIALMFIAVISMIFIALIGMASKDIPYKIFSYMTVYYIIYLLAALSLDDKLILPLSFSMFAFIIIVAAMVVVFDFIETNAYESNVLYNGILCATPRTYFVLSFMTLAAIGLPISSFFLNNFVIVSKIFGYTVWFGAITILSMLLASTSFIQELSRMHDSTKLEEDMVCIMDMPKRFFGFMIVVMMVLFASFLNPLWFVGG